MKHMENKYLWTQEQLALGHIKPDTVASKDNCSDLLTKTLSKNDVQRYMQAMNQEFREGRAIANKHVLTGDDNASTAGNR